MKFFTKTSAAVIVAALGLAAIAPVALANDQDRQAGPGFGPRHEQGFHARNQDGPRFGGMHQDGERGDMRGGILNLACSTDGAARLGQMLTSMSDRVQLTDEQKPLFDALKTAALTAQTGFADTCATILPQTGATAGQPNMVERLQTRLKVDEARTAALSEVLPSLEAFYNGLTDEQKATLDAGPGEGRGHFGKRHGGPGNGFGQHRQMIDKNG